MQTNLSTNIVPLLGKVCAGLQHPYRNKGIEICFSSSKKKVLLTEPAEKLSSSFTKFLCSVLDLIPAGNSLFVTVQISADKNNCLVIIRNTGINLKIAAGIFKKSLLPVTFASATGKETVFEIIFPLASTDFAVDPNPNQQAADSPFNYIAVIRGIRTYFSKIKSPAELLTASNPKEGRFLQKVNATIMGKIGDERFDANALSTELAMSRAQLLRRLKKLTGLSPGQYIKSIRLQKAKEMLEADVTVSEAAYESGFGTLSNFTKVFREKYGITPSQWRQARPVQQINKK